LTYPTKRHQSQITFTSDIQSCTAIKVRIRGKKGKKRAFFSSFSSRALSNLKPPLVLLAHLVELVELHLTICNSKFQKARNTSKIYVQGESMGNVPPFWKSVFLELFFCAIRSTELKNIFGRKKFGTCSFNR
jgi:hypothetical protein